MTRLSQIMIGTASGLLGLAILVSALLLLNSDLQPGQQPDPKSLIVLATFAFCVCAACFFPSSRPITMRLIGAFLLFSGFMCLYLSVTSPDKSTTIQALIFTALLGAGGGWLTFTGKYPSWGAGGAYFEFIRKANSKQKNAD
jgi:FtsH-binding integral membrane protein